MSGHSFDKHVLFLFRNTIVKLKANYLRKKNSFRTLKNLFLNVFTHLPASGQEWSKLLYEWRFTDMSTIKKIH